MSTPSKGTKRPNSSQMKGKPKKIPVRDREETEEEGAVGGVEAAATEAGKEQYTLFYSKASPFSQHHHAEFTVDGLQYNCAEQYMMHQKAGKND